MMGNIFSLIIDINITAITKKNVQKNYNESMAHW